MLFLDPNDEDSRLLLARIQVHLGIDLEEVCFISQFLDFINTFRRLLANGYPCISVISIKKS